MARKINPEKAVATTIIKYLRELGWMCLRLQAGLVTGYTGGMFRLNAKGTADWVCLRPDFSTPSEGQKATGRCQVFFLETKAAGKHLRPEQVQWILEAKRLGYEVVVTDGANIFRSWYEKTFPGEE